MSDIESEDYDSQEEEKLTLEKKEIDDVDVDVDDDDDIDDDIVDDELDADNIMDIQTTFTNPEDKQENTYQLLENITGDDYVNKIELSDDDDDDDSYDGIESLQKFDDDLKKEYLEAIHPESKQYNYNEIESLCKIVRNSDGDIVDELHKTQCWISKYEYTRIIGQRTKQLNQGVKPFINVPSNIINNDIIAEMEMKEKKLPFIIRRPLPNGGSEFWKLKDLELISY